MLHMESDPDSVCFTTFINTLSNNKNNKMQRRFTHQQIKSLETIFQSESKLEPRKKLQLAKDLGLQPRQIAIWFQNKRARWKSKQLERDYNILRASYDSLSSRFELLNRENQSLTNQLKKLQEMMEKKVKGSSTREDSYNSSKEKVSDDDSSMKPEYIEHHNIDMVVGNGNGNGNGENWDDLECHQLLDGDSSNQWLDFWS